MPNTDSFLTKCSQEQLSTSSMDEDEEQEETGTILSHQGDDPTWPSQMEHNLDQNHVETLDQNQQDTNTR